MKLIYIMMTFFIILLIIVASGIAIVVCATTIITTKNLPLSIITVFFSSIIVISIIILFKDVINSLLDSLFSGDKKKKYYKNLVNEVNEKSSGKFEDMYKKLYDENYEYFEERRKNERNMKILSIIIQITIFIVIYTLIETDLVSDDKYFLVWASIPIFIYIRYLISKKSRGYDYAIKFKERIIRNLILSYNNSLTYNPVPENVDELQMKYIFSDGLDSSTSDFFADDYVSGKIKDLNFEFFNVHTTRAQGDGVVTVFSGIFLVIDLNRQFNTKIRIMGKGMQESRYKNDEDLRRGETEDKVFNELFDLYANRLVYGMDKFANDLIKLIYSFQEINSNKIQITIKDNKVYIRFHTGDIFEPRIYRSSMDKTYLAMYYNILDLIFSVSTLVLDDIVDLNI